MRQYVASQEDDDKKVRRRTLLSVEDDVSVIRQSLADTEAPVSRQSVQEPKKSDDQSIADAKLEDVASSDDIGDHDQWESQYMLLTHMIASAFDGSNIWRSGYLFHKYGGAAFLIPYTFFTLVIAFPGVYLELLIGQYAQVGAIAAFKFVPILKGVGICMVLVAVVDVFQLHAIMAWCTFYILQSIAHESLPWVSCDNGYGRKQNGEKDTSVTIWDDADDVINANYRNWHTENCSSFYPDSGTDGQTPQNERLPGTEYFRGRVLGTWTNGFKDSVNDKNFSGINGAEIFGMGPASKALDFGKDWEMFWYLLFAFVVGQIFVSRGIKMSVTAMLLIIIFPVVAIVLLFFRGTGLQGAWDGLATLFHPDFAKLLDTETWCRAAQQVLYSSSTGFGVHLTLASHNPKNRRLIYDALFTVSMDYVMCIFAASTVFLYLGHVKYVVERDLNKFVSSGPQMVFEAMADVLGVLAKPNFYSVIFYSLIFFLSLTTVATTLMTAKIAFFEILPPSIKHQSGRKVFLCLIILIGLLLLSYFSVSRAGLHVFYFLGTFCGKIAVVACVLLFQIGIAWIYGLKAVVQAAQEMQIRLPGIYFQVCWRYISPFVLGTVFVLLCLDSNSYIVIVDDVEVNIGYWLILGYFIAFAPFAIILIAAIYTVWTSPGKTCKQKILMSISPTSEHAAILAGEKASRSKWSHWCYFYADTGVKCNICCSLYPTRRQTAPEPSRKSAPKKENPITITVSDHDLDEIHSEESHQSGRESGESVRSSQTRKS